MGTIRIQIAAICFLAAGFCYQAQSQPPSPAPREIAQHDKTESSAKKQVRYENQNNAIDFLSEINKLRSEIASWENAQSTKERKGNSPSDWWLKWSTIITAIITALATFVIAVLAYYQWRAMDKQARYMRDALAQTQKSIDALMNNERAWVTVGIGGDEAPSRGTGGETLQAFNYFVIEPTLEVNGRSPAVIKLIKVVVEPSVVLATLPETPNYDSAEHCFPVDITLVPSKPIRPITIPVSVMNFEPQPANHILFIFGVVCYEDVFERCHESRFAYGYLIPGGASRRYGWHVTGPPAYNRQASNKSER